MIINGTSYQIVVGYNAPTDPLANTIKYRTFIDGGVRPLNYGARKERVAEFTMINITRSNFVSLADYLILNAGKKIAITPENSGESIFPDFPYGTYTTYYVYVLEPKGLQEEDFSTTDNLYKIALKVALAGADDSGAIPNEADTSLIDLLIEVDTTAGATKQATAPSSPSSGDKWFDTDDNRLYRYQLYENINENNDSDNVNFGLSTATWTKASKTLTQTGAFTGYTFTSGDKIYITDGTDATKGIYEIAGKTDNDNITLTTEIAASDLGTGDIKSNWTPIYTVAADNANYGFVDGSFYWSAFSDVTWDGKTWKSGFLTYKSVNIPGQSINISKGPSIAKREGFSFSVANIDNDLLITKFWEFIISTKINLYGATCIQHVFEYGVDAYKQMTATNRSNDYTYTDYKFKVEPFTLNKQGKFPSSEIEDDPDTQGERYDYIKSNFIGKSVYATFGEHRYAALQNVSTEKRLIEVKRLFPPPLETINPITTSIVLQIESGVDKTDLYVNKKKTHTSLNSYEFSSELLTDLATTRLAIQVVADTNGVTNDANKGEVRRITAIDNSDSDWLVLTMNSPLPVDSSTNNTGDGPDTNDKLTVVLIRFKFRFQIDDEECEGFGVRTPSTVPEGKKWWESEFTKNTVKLFRLNSAERELVELPNTNYFVEEDNNNSLFLDPLVSADSSKTITYKPINVPVAPITPSFDTPIHEYTELLDHPSINLGLPTPAPYDNGYMPMNAIGGLDIIHPFVLRAHSEDPPFWGYITGWSNPTDQAEGTAAHTFTTAYNGYYKTWIEHGIAIAWKMQVEHQPEESSFVNSDNVKLVMRLEVESAFTVIQPGSSLKRYHPAGFAIKIRFKKFDGTYVENNSAWLHEIDSKHLGVSNNNVRGKVVITNEPNLSDSGTNYFTSSKNTLTNNVDYIITFKGSSSPPSPRIGDLWWREDLSPQRLSAYTESGWQGVSDAIIVPDGKIIQQIPPGATVSAVYIVTGGVLAIADAGDDYLEETVQYGNDLWDLSDDLFGESGVWADVESMEVIVSTHDQSNFYNEVWQSGADYRWEIRLQLGSSTQLGDTPALYTLEEVETVDQPLFVAAQGRHVDDAYTSDPVKIIKSILDSETMFKNKYDSSSLTTLMTQGERVNWDWHRQFTSSMSSVKVLQEILLNLWATAILNENDELVFKRLDFQESPSTTFSFDDSNIIKDSISAVKYRDASQIYQELILNYDYNVPSEFSSALLKFNETLTINKDTAGSEGINLSFSELLYNLLNTKTLDFKYHYKNLEGIKTWVTKHLAFNAWKFKFKTAMEDVLFSSRIELMDVISVKSYFHTDNDELFGFVTSLKPDFYEGVVEIGVFILEPPGKYGVLCDPHNDALHVLSRDITDWTDINGRRNDAGRVSTRTLANYTKKDAGRVSTRKFCQ